MKTAQKTENRALREQQQQPGQPQPQPARERGYISPAVNISENKDGYFLEAEMPGVTKAGLEVLLEGNELTIIGRREPEPDGAQLVYRESSPRDYARSFVLDPAIDTGRINARMENGVLVLDLPKAERVKPRKITVTD